MAFWRFDWWRNEDNRDGATALASILKLAVPALLVVVVAVAGWLGFDMGGDSGSKPSIQTGDHSPVQTGNGNQIIQGDNSSVVIGMTIEQHEAILIRRENQLRSDLTRVSEAESSLIQRELDAVQGQMADLTTSYETALEDLRKLRLKLNSLAGRVPQNQLEAAQKALFEGDRSEADVLLAEVEAQAEDTIKVAAQAAYLRGEIAEQEIRWHDAAKHYVRAAQLDPELETLVKAREFTWRSGDYTSALRFGQDLIASARRGGSQETIASALNEHAVTLSETGNHVESERLLREALEIDKATIGEWHPAYATHLGNLAIAISDQGRYAEAETLYRRVLEVDRATIGENHPDIAIGLNNLASIIEALGRYDEAETLYLEALEIDRVTIGEGHPDYATGLNNLAGVVKAQGRYAEAETLYRKSLEIDKATIGDRHPIYASGLNNLALVVHEQGRYAEAETLYREVLEVDKATIGKDHPSYAAGLNNLARVFKDQGRYDEAEKLYVEALELSETVLGPDHPDTLKMRGNLESLRAKTTVENDDP